MSVATHIADHPFTWRAHPARERASRAALGTALILVMAGLMAIWFTDPLAALLAGAGTMALLVLALNRFFFPSRFSIDAEGITAHHPLRTRRLKWTDLRRFVHDGNGGYLSTRARRTRLDAYGGMHILFGTCRDAVVDRIGACMARDQEVS